MRADAVVQRAQDEVTLLTARFDVRRAELDVQGSLLSSAIDKQKFVLTLEEAKARLAQLQDDLQSRTASDRASLAVLEEKRNKARLQMDNAQQQHRQHEAARAVRRSCGRQGQRHEQRRMGRRRRAGIPRRRHRVPGRPVAEVLHQSGIELIAKVSEYDRAHLNAGQNAEVNDSRRAGQESCRPLSSRSPAPAGATCGRGTIRRERSTSASTSRAAIQQGCARALRRRCSSLVRQSKRAKYLPRQALFEQDGKPVVFVRQGRSFEPREVKVLDRTETYVVVGDLPVGTEVALRNPLADQAKGAGSAGPVQPRAGS